MKTLLKRLFPVFAAVALALPYCSNLARGQVSSQPQPFTTTAASGVLGPFPCVGATTATWTWTTGTAGTLTIQGSADAVVNGTYNTNTSFGASGIVTAPGAGTISSGNTANYPQGIQATFTGNSGTFSGFVTCSGGLGSVSSSGTSNSVITAPTSNVDGPNAILAHVTNPTLPPAPLPTASAGALPPASTAQMVVYPACTYTTGTTNLTVGNSYAMRCDQRGNTKTVVCGSNLNQCVAIAQGIANALLVYNGPSSAAKTALTTTCTNVAAAPAFLVNVAYLGTSGTGILNIYNESAATCAAADLVYTSSAAITTAQMISWPTPCTLGITYQWSVAAPTTAALIGYI